MNNQDILLQFTEQVRQTPVLEIIAVVFGMLSVVLANRNHVALYPTGIISTAIFIYIMSRPAVKLYAEAWLNAYYLVMSVYGWVRWSRHKENQNARAISTNTTRDWAVTAAIVVGGWMLLYTILRNYTDSDVPVLDAVVSATAWAGMWLLAKHKVENWVLLNISNAIAIPLQLYKGIPLTAFLTFFLFIVAIFGYIRWKKLYRLQHAA